MQQEKSKFELLREKSILAILDGDTDVTVKSPGGWTPMG